MWFSTVSVVRASRRSGRRRDRRDAHARPGGCRREDLGAHAGAPAGDARGASASRPTGALAVNASLLLVEDVAQAAGASGTRPAMPIGDAGTFSFQQAKLVTSGEGGMVVTSDAADARRAATYDDARRRCIRLLDGGVAAGADLRTTESDRRPCAVVQLERLDGIVAALRERSTPHSPPKLRPLPSAASAGAAPHPEGENGSRVPGRSSRTRRDRAGRSASRTSACPRYARIR